MKRKTGATTDQYNQPSNKTILVESENSSKMANGCTTSRAPTTLNATSSSDQPFRLVQNCHLSLIVSISIFLCDVFCAERPKAVR